MSRSKSIFLKAIQEPQENRLEYVKSIVRDDVVTLREVCGLLDAFDKGRKSEKFLLDCNFPEAIGVSFGSSKAGELEGKTFGNYHLLAKIGAGSHGAVYKAEQIAPVKRSVAVKFLSFSGCSEHLARFQIECAVAAKMEHPNVARVYGAKSASEFGPYLVMELIDGKNVVDHCRDNQLSIAERIELFKSVCYGIRHAHQKGCIHRDIKPSNVLVQTVDNRYVPKVIDFGVAKINFQSNDISRSPTLTTDGQFVGSLVYSSPEQIESSKNLVDVRSDIYSLGVMLFELLTGELPVPKDKLKNCGLSTQIRMLTEGVFDMPSKRVRSMVDHSDFKCSSGKQRSTTLRGELDWIVAKCLENNPADRYQDINALIQDLQLYAQGRPISVGPPSMIYQAKRFVERNKKPVFISLLIGALASLLLIGSIVGLIQARNEKLAKGIQQARAEESSEVFEFFAKDLRSPHFNLIGNVKSETVDHMLHNWSRVGFHNQENEESIRSVAVEIFAQTGKSEKAKEQYEIIRRACQNLEPSDPRSMRLTYLEAIMAFGSPPDVSEEEARKVVNKLGKLLEFQEMVLGERHKDSLKTREFLALACLKAKDFHRCEAVRLKLVDIYSNDFGENDFRTIRAKTGLCDPFAETKDLDEQIKWVEYSCKLLAENFGKHNYTYAMFVLRLSSLYAEADRIDEHLECRTNFCDVMDMLEPPNAGRREELAEICFKAGDIDRAIKNITHAIEINKENLEERRGEKYNGSGVERFKGYIEADKAVLAKYEKHRLALNAK